MNKFYLPAEWYVQDAVMLTWPHEQTDWLHILKQVEPVYIEISKHVTARQQLIIVCNNEQLKTSVSQLLQQNDINLDKVHFVVCPTDDTWARDHGPITLVNDQGQILALDYIFNGWGNKFSASQDNQINQHVFAKFEVNNAPQDFVLEGGGIEVDGSGCLMVTSECLLNPNRNSNYSQAQIEQLLMDTFGCTKTLWVDFGELEGDDTDAHIDTLVRFAPNNTLVYQGCDKPQDSHFVGLEQMKAQLCQFTNVQGERYKLYELPWPAAQFSKDGDRLPATYANFLIINGAVLMPVYGVEQDQQAINIMQQAFAGYEIIPINCRPIIEQFGSLHCITMQLPKGFLQRV